MLGLYPFVAIPARQVRGSLECVCCALGQPPHSTMVAARRFGTPKVPDGP
jgi:hypothetical protein